MRIGYEQGQLVVESDIGGIGELLVADTESSHLPQESEPGIQLHDSIITVIADEDIAVDVEINIEGFIKGLCSLDQRTY